MFYHSGLMNKFITGCTPGSNPKNFATADATSLPVYFNLASKYAISDNYFQSLIGGSGGNTMYYVRAGFEVLAFIIILK